VNNNIDTQMTNSRFLSHERFLDISVKELQHCTIEIATINSDAKRIVLFNPPTQYFLAIFTVLVM